MSVPKKSRRLVRAYENLGYEVKGVSDDGIVTMQWKFPTESGEEPIIPFFPKHQRILIREGVSMLNRCIGDCPHISRTQMPIINGRALSNVYKGEAVFRKIGEPTPKEGWHPGSIRLSHR